MVLKSGGTISIAPSRLINLAGRFDDVNKIYLTVFESTKSFASFTVISSLLTVKKSNL